jgi:hypothetical protein
MMPFVSGALPYFLARNIAESQMVEIDPYYFYSLARTVHGCLIGMGLTPPAPTPVFAGKYALEEFVGSGKPEFLSKSKEKAKDIINLINNTIDSSHRRVAIELTDYAFFHATINEFEVQLKEECKHLYVLCVDDQRLMSAYVLVEHIEKSCAPTTWKYLSRLSRREIEESGRCLAVERYTASGFHVLRCVESIIREYIAACGVTLKDSERNWGKYAEILRDNGAAHEVTNMIDNLRTDDRNTLMHPEKFLNQDGAIGLFYLCQTALDRLINDMGKRDFAKEFTP